MTNTNTASVSLPTPTMNPVINLTSVFQNNKNNEITSTNNNTEAPISFSNIHKTARISTRVDPIRDKEDIQKILAYYDNKPQRFTSSYSNIRDKAIFIMGVCCGRRIGDILNLTYADIFNPNMTYKPIVTIKEEKTDKLIRFVLRPEAQNALTAYISMKKNIHMDDCIFTSRTTSYNGKPTNNRHITREQIWKSYKDMSHSTGLDMKYNIGTHSARKTAGIALYEASEHNIDMVRDFYNHSSVKTTQRYIATSETERLRMTSLMDLGL